MNGSHEPFIFSYLCCCRSRRFLRFQSIRRAVAAIVPAAAAGRCTKRSRTSAPTAPSIQPPAARPPTFSRCAKAGNPGGTSPSPPDKRLQRSPRKKMFPIFRCMCKTVLGSTAVLSMRWQLALPESSDTHCSKSTSAPLKKQTTVQRGSSCVPM